MKRKTSKRRISRRRISLRIAIISFLVTILSICGIENLRLSMLDISDTYSDIVDIDYTNLDYVNRISVNVHQYHALLHEYLWEDSDEVKRNIQEETDTIDKNIAQIIKNFNDNAKNGKYSSVSHEIYSKCIGLLKSIDMFFDLCNNKSLATSIYYLKGTVKPDMDDVLSEISMFRIQVDKDIKTAKDNMNNRIYFIRYIAISVVIFILIATIISIFYYIRLSSEMVSGDTITVAKNYDYLLRIGEKYLKRKKLHNYACIAISIRDFKYINQEHGSVAADRILAEYTWRLINNTDRGEVISRNGGDNFLALIDKGHVESFLSFISSINLTIDDQEFKGFVNIDSRCGVYPACEDDDIRDIINCANIALSYVRSGGYGNQAWYDDSMSSDLLKEKEVLELFDEAIKNKEFIVYYQPKVDMRTNILCGAEALVRWIRDDKLVPPGDFIPVFERDGKKIQELDFYVFRTVCEDIHEWISRGIKPVKISTNFSKLHLENTRFSEDVESVIDAKGVDPKLLEAELTESSAYGSYDAMETFVLNMKQKGVSTSMDDFGTGYSSLSLLRDMDFDVVKLDRSFLRDIEKGNKANEKMLENIVRMLNDLDRDVICEGVETMNQVNFLMSVGCYRAQGFLYDKPLPHDAFEERLMNPEYDLG